MEGLTLAEAVVLAAVSFTTLVVVVIGCEVIVLWWRGMSLRRHRDTLEGAVADMLARECRRALHESWNKRNDNDGNKQQGSEDRHPSPGEDPDRQEDDGPSR